MPCLKIINANRAYINQYQTLKRKRNLLSKWTVHSEEISAHVHLVQKCKAPAVTGNIKPYPTAFTYGNGMVLHFYQQQQSSTTKTVHKVINKGLKAYV